jgi:hypothetical protein
VENQSAIRERYCRSPFDVLYGVTDKGHHFDEHVAKLTVGEVEMIDYPNMGTEIKDRTGKIIKEAARYSLRVMHEPEQCMYPHCELRLHIDDKPYDNKKKVPPRVKTNMRHECAMIAERYRSEISRLSRPISFSSS